MNRTLYDSDNVYRGYRYRVRESRESFPAPRYQKSRARYDYCMDRAAGRRTAIGRGYPRLIRAVCVLMICALLMCVGAGAARGIMRISYPRRYEMLVRENCSRFGVEESLVYAVIRTESGFDPEARSSVGAMGLMQIMPETFEWLQSKLPSDDGNDRLPETLLYDPEINIRYGVYYLSMLREEFGSDTLTAAAYHAGGGKVRQWISAGQLDAGCGYEDIPSGVTGHYVRKVEKARDVYLRLYYSEP